MLSQEVQENHDGVFGYPARDPAIGPVQYFPDVPAPLPNVMLMGGLRNIVERYLNHPGTRVNMLRIEPGNGGFEVRIVLQLADII